MGTRGTYGFRKNGVDKLTYNHYDSYPEHLGRSVCEFIASNSDEDLEAIYDRIELVNEDELATPEQVEECKQWLNTGVSTGKPEEWYCLLRNAQGDLDAYKKGLKYMIDSQYFLKDSLFCEYGYIINLDTKKLEFWSGYQRRPQEGNRYGTKGDGRGYYPCKLIASYSFNAIRFVSESATFIDAVDVIVENMRLKSEYDYKEQKREKELGE